MKNFSSRLYGVLKGSIHQCGEIETIKINFSKDVVAACAMNYCGMYGKTWQCPPAVGTLEELKKKYQNYKYAFVFTTKHTIEDSFDIEGMFDARIEHEKAESLILPLLKENNAQILGAGGCKICKSCTYPDSPCRFPEKAKPSVEACGIDVVNLAASCGINYHNGENTVTYFSVVFFN